MKYNFDSYINRGDIGSSKWFDMYDKNPNVEKNIIPMSVADMDFIPCPEINEEICDFINTQSLGYAEPIDSYLESVVKFFKEYHGYEAKKEWIVTTPGIVPALATSVKSFTEVGDGVIIFTPVYGPFYNVIKGQERKALECPLIIKNNRYTFDFELLEKLASDSNSKMLLLCSPHNPGGTVWTKEELLKIAEIVERNNLIIVSDEIHSDIIFNNNEHIVFGNVNNTIGNRSIVCTAASKTFNIAGLQCSNIFIENEELRSIFAETNRVMGIKKANVLGLVATEAAYNKGLNWLEEAKTVISENNQIVEEFFEGYNGVFKAMKPEASFTVWVNFENLNITHEKFMNFLNNEAFFFVSDGLIFGEAGRNFMRVNTGLPTKKLRQNLERLKLCLNRSYNI